MSQLLGPTGKPISSTTYNKKETPPPTGNAFGAWAGRDLTYAQLPGGGLVGFDLNRLAVPDFRTMRDHYQINSSLAVLSFMQHQSDWSIECEDPKIATKVEADLREIWTGLNRMLAQANWAGYSPAAIDWENNVGERSIDVKKVKDLVPEECAVNWKEVDGWAPPDRTPPKFKIYDGIKQFGQPWPIPVDNSLWYPLLMENGDYAGRKLLRPAFTSWYFSLLIHLFANRYYERFGEPTPVGRAPFDDEITVQGTRKPGNEFMLDVLADLRSRSVVVLPTDSIEGNNGSREFEYSIEYLESQMRGADFERYMTRLDEEMSIGLFTPILLLRTADVGSYNLGVGHMQMYLWMLNAMNDDRKQYIDKYLLSRMVDFNFSKKAPRAKIKFRKLGNANGEMLATILQALIQNDKAAVDLEELGGLLGMTLTEVAQTVDPPDAPAPDPADPGTEGGGGEESARSASRVQDVVTEIVSRVRKQAQAAWRDDRFDSDLAINMGFKRKMQQAFIFQGVSNPDEKVNRLYGALDHWLSDYVGLGKTGIGDIESFMVGFTNVLQYEIDQLVK